MDDLPLGLDGTTLVFPDGAARCLACGGAPAGTKRVYFEDTDGIGLAGKLDALSNRLEFDAPLCERHLKHARSLPWKVAIYGVLALVVGVAALVYLLESRLYERSAAAWLLAAPGAFLVVVAYVGWSHKDRGGLRCEAERTADGGVRLSWPK